VVLRSTISSMSASSCAFASPSGERLARGAVEREAFERPEQVGAHGVELVVPVVPDAGAARDRRAVHVAPVAAHHVEWQAGLLPAAGDATDRRAVLGVLERAQAASLPGKMFS
jgi:MoxR-like ATPase